MSLLLQFPNPCEGCECQTDNTIYCPIIHGVIPEYMHDACGAWAYWQGQQESAKAQAEHMAKWTIKALKNLGYGVAAHELGLEFKKEGIDL